MKVWIKFLLKHITMVYIIHLCEIADFLMEVLYSVLGRGFNQRKRFLYYAKDLFSPGKIGNGVNLDPF